MKSIINGIMSRPDGVKRFAKVIKKHSHNRYVVRDKQGRTFQAESETIWRSGNFVSVVDGRITGEASVFAEPKTINV
jgi:hypothetical protein